MKERKKDSRYNYACNLSQNVFAFSANAFEARHVPVLKSGCVQGRISTVEISVVETWRARSRRQTERKD